MVPSSGGGKKLIRKLRVGAPVGAGENIGVGVGEIIGATEGATDNVSAGDAEGSCATSAIALPTKAIMPAVKIRDLRSKICIASNVIAPVQIRKNIIAPLAIA